MADILIIEDDIAFAQLLQRFLEKHGHTVAMTNTIATGKALLLKNSYDIALLDYRLPDGSGMDILHMLRDNELPVSSIIMTSYHDVRTAIKTIRLGAYDYITKPVNPDELLLVIREVLNKKMPQPAPGIPSVRPLAALHSRVSQQLHDYIGLVAPTDFSVIIQGDNGTGKELVARSIHEQSKRKNAPFVALDCGALSADLAGSELFGHVKGAFTGALQNKRGQFEEANGGTLFLDEIGNLSYDIQVKLLRVLQERIIQPVGSNQQVKIDVRIICATNEQLTNAVKNGRFREDLYHRLNEFAIRMPSLQERREDIPAFIEYFIAQTNEELGKSVKSVTTEVSDLFARYDWPGNVRELKNIIRRAVLLAKGDEINSSCLPAEMILSVKEEQSPVHNKLKAAQALSEKEIIIRTLEQVKYNKSKAARLLNIDRTTLYYKMSKYHING